MTSGSVAAEAASPPASSAASAAPARLSSIATFPAAISALLVMLAVLTVRDRFDDPDMWWHLRTGQIIATTHHIPQTDLFSYTTNHHFYIAHEWLSQLSIYAAYAFRGYTGLMLWEAGLTAAILVAGFYLCSLYSGTPKLGFLGALAIWFFGTIGFSVRPQMLGYLLLVLELLLLHLGRTRSRRWFLLLPPLFAVWVNCHGSFMLGLLILAFAVIACVTPISFAGVESGHLEARYRNVLIAATVLSFAAVLLNPTGVRQVLYPLQIVWHSPVNLTEVHEWHWLGFDDSRFYALVGIVACIVIPVLLRRARLTLDEWLLLALVATQAVRHRRLVFVFGIVAAPIFCRVLSSLWQERRPQVRHPLADITLILASAFVSYAAFPSPANLSRQVEAFSPVGAVAFIEQHHLRGPIINAYGFGGYLIWAAPEYPVFVDGRTDIFEWTGVLRRYGDWATRKSPPADLLDQYGVNLCLFAPDSPIVPSLQRLPGWTQVYSDKNAVIFIRTPAATIQGSAHPKEQQT